MGSWKAGSPTSNTQSRQVFIDSWLWLHGNMGPTSKDGKKRPWRPQTKKIYSKLHCDRYELLGSREDSKFWVHNIYGEESLFRIHHWFTSQTSTLMMFELDCDSQLNNSPLPAVWSSNEWNVFAKKNAANLARMDSLDGLTCRINLFSALHHILWTSAAERLAAPIPTPCC